MKLKFTDFAVDFVWADQIRGGIACGSDENVVKPTVFSADSSSWPPIRSPALVSSLVGSSNHHTRTPRRSYWLHLRSTIVTMVQETE